MTIWMQRIRKLWQAQKIRRCTTLFPINEIHSAATSHAPEKCVVHVWVDHAVLLCKALNFSVSELLILIIKIHKQTNTPPHTHSQNVNAYVTIFQVIFVMSPAVQNRTVKIYESLQLHPIALEHLVPALMKFYTGKKGYSNNLSIW